MIFNTEYYSTLDRGYYNASKGKYVDDPVLKEPITNLTPFEMGSSEADIGGGTPLQKFDAAIRQGSAKVEFTFFGQGKSGGQQHTPESVGKIEREQIREMARLNNAKFSVHATVAINGASGMTREGFSEEARSQTLREINKAIEFAGDASTGGAVVFHTGEWHRPLTDVKGGMFRQYGDEDSRSPVMVVDGRTGEIQAFRKDHKVYEPKFHTATTYEKELGKKIVGVRDKNGNIVEKDDWVDINGNAIKREWLLDQKKSEELFNRVPVWNKDKTNFAVEEHDFTYFEKQAKNLGIAPEVYFMKSQLANQVLQYKGNSLFHGLQYDELKEERDALKKALDYYNSLEVGIPDNEKWRLLVNKFANRSGGFLLPKDVMPSEYLTQSLKQTEDRMRHIHESSASADAMARQALEKMNEVTTLENFGLKKTTKTIAEVGMTAMEVSKKKKDELREAIYVAPESFMPQMYGSHPDEIRTIIESSRKEMAKMLQQKGYGSEEAKDLAKKHIKATIDTGHFNMWRRYFQAKEGESPEKAEKRFEKWYLDETEKLAKDGVIGHVHLTDNFGYDDEHVTPGQGNAPIKEFIQRMEKAGIKDFIVERGGENPHALWETLEQFGSPIYGIGHKMNMSQIRHAHFGYGAPANYIVGAYSPSNEFRLWSEVPLE